MVSYCKQDVNLTEKVYLALAEKMQRLGYSELSCEIEHRIAEIIRVQEMNGVWFNVSAAERLKAELETKKAELSKEIKELFPPRLEPVAEYKVRRRKDGTPFAQFEKHQEKYPRIDLYEEAGESWYRCYDYKEFNLGSPKQRIERLLELGWEPQEFTKKGSPKVDEDALVKFSEVSGHPQIKALADWLVVHGRLTMLAGNPETGSKGWLGNVRDHGNGDTRIHGRVLSCGAITRRMTHLVPNCVPLYSQALTRNGWKYYHELDIGEDILAYDLETRTKKWTPLLDISVFDKAEVYSFGQQHPHKRLYCTKNHSWVVKDRDSKGYKNTEKLVEAQRLKYNRPVKINAPFENDVVKTDFRLIQEKYEHDWVSEVCKMSDVELHAFMQGFLLADGCRPKGHVNWQFAQAEGPLLDALMTCFYLVTDTRISAATERRLKGINQRMGYNIVQCTSQYMRTKDMSIRYEGEEAVWCPTTKFGTWVMKQRDFITITGNTANIPKEATAKYGAECRALWGVKPDTGLVMLGYDASGLETAGLCHYLNNKKASEILLRPKPDDIHSLNMAMVNRLVPKALNREQLKAPWYGWLYGAYPPKIGKLVGGTPETGQKIIDIFYQNVPGLKRLVEEVHYEFNHNHGLLTTVDNGFVRCGSINASLNYRIQSMGGILMKLSAILLHEKAQKDGFEFRQLLSVHDEYQFELPQEQAEEFGRLAVWSIEEAGRQLKTNVPVTGSYKIGVNWQATH